MRQVIVFDQFCGVSPYALQQHPMAFAELLADVQANPDQFGYRRPQVMDVDDNYEPRMATTIIAADDNGQACVWKYRWDSSD